MLRKYLVAWVSIPERLDANSLLALAQNALNARVRKSHICPPFSSKPKIPHRSFLRLEAALARRLHGETRTIQEWSSRGRSQRFLLLALMDNSLAPSLVKALCTVDLYRITSSGRYVSEFG